jgi:tetratricopeptide (TPR) repeat protein
MPDYASFVYSTLGNAYQSQGDFSKAIKYHTQHLAIAKEVGNRAGEGRAYGNLGTCHMLLNEYVKAVAYFEAREEHPEGFEGRSQTMN